MKDATLSYTIRQAICGEAKASNWSRTVTKSTSVRRSRENRTFAGLVLNERLEREGVAPKCAICIVNLKTGDLEHRLEIEEVVQELYDVAVLPGITRPMALGFRFDEIRFAVRPETGEPTALEGPAVC